MPSPFPGMNPYLEHPDRWSTVHNRLIVALADALTPQLLPNYQVDIEKRVYTIIGMNSLLLGRPDVTVQRPRQPPAEGAGRVVVSEPAAQPVKVSLPTTEEVREAYLEIKEAATQIVVTAIEILSPTNKRGEGRQKYEQKRQQVLNSRTHLVEIDLLRDGDPLPMMGDAEASPYRILISRANLRPLADLYPFNLADPIPSVPMPLQAGDAEPIVNLQSLLMGVYERSGYDYFIDYHSDPSPPLTPEELTWINNVLTQQGRR
jgi:hypothetical protein